MRFKLVAKILLVGLLALTSAVASETYSYTGNRYGQCSGSYANVYGQCLDDYFVSGSFTTTLSLNQLESVTNFTIPIVDISSFSFSDGSGLTINQLNANLGATSFEITTNSSGNITSPQGWDVFLVEASGTVSNSPLIYTNSCDIAPCVGAYDGSQISAASQGETAFKNPGIWQGPLQSTPEVPTFFLLGAGLLGMAKRVRQ